MPYSACPGPATGYHEVIAKYRFPSHLPVSVYLTPISRCVFFPQPLFHVELPTPPPTVFTLDEGCVGSTFVPDRIVGESLPITDSVLDEPGEVGAKRVYFVPIGILVIP